MYGWKVLKKVLKKRSFSLIVIMILVISGFPYIFELDSEYSTADATTIIVDKSGGGDYAMIQLAINAANPYDEIYVWAGTYNENVIINKPLTLIGNGTTNTTINGGGSGDIVTITADGVKISGFTITNTDGSGIKMEDFSNCTISNNTFSNNGFGIFIRYSKNNLINNNTCSNNILGIRLYCSSNDSLKNNICSNIGLDVNLWYTSSSYLEDNKMYSYGLYIYGYSIEHWDSHILINNTINNKTIYYYKNVKGGTIPSNAGQIILANCTNMNITNHKISTRPIGIQLGFSNNNTIQNNTCDSNLHAGIHLYSSSGNTLSNNTCNSNDRYGIYFEYFSNNNLLINNSCKNNQRGIFLDRSSINALKNNNCSDNSYGIDLGYSSDNNTLFNNTCINSNYGYGIGLTSSSFNIIINNTCLNNSKGIHLWYSSSNNKIINNNCSKNEWAGIMLEQHSHNNLLLNNSCYFINRYGILTQTSSGNSIINNTIYSCGIGISIGGYEDSHTVKNNTLNGKPILYLKNVNGGKIPEGMAQIILVNVSNIILENQNISNAGVSVSLTYSNNNIIRNNTFSWNYFTGIELSSSLGNIITNNTCNWNNEVGIRVGGGSDNWIISNNCSKNNYGIDISVSWRNNISNNELCYNKEYGINMYNAFNNIFYNNSINLNYDDGIFLYDSSNNRIINNIFNSNNHSGLILYFEAVNNTIASNNFDSNKGYGIQILGGGFNLLNNNILYNNSCGVELQGSSNNILTANTIFENNYGIRLIWSARYNQIINCSIYSNSNNDFYLDQESYHNVAINTTFIKVNNNVWEPALIVKNYLHIQVNDSNGLPVSGVDVQVKDNGYAIYKTSDFGGTNQKTNSLGQIKWILVTDRIYRGSIGIMEQNTTVKLKSNKFVFRNNNINVNMTKSHFEYFDANGKPNRIELLSPLNHSSINDSTPELTWHPGIDMENDPLSYFVQVDEFGDDWSTPVYEINLPQFITSKNLTKKLNDGSYQWRVHAIDEFQNGSWSDIWQFNVDSNIPIANVPIIPDTYVNTNTLNWTWLSSPDTGSGIFGYYVYIYSAVEGKTIVNGYWTNNTWFEYSDLVNDESYYCRIKAKNGAGTLSEYSEYSDLVTVDYTPPKNVSIKINNGSEYSNSTSVVISISAVDSVSGLNSIRLRSEDVDWGDWVNIQDNFVFNLSNGDGKKTIYCEVQDRAGNIAQPVTKSIILDTNAPHSLNISINNDAIVTKSAEVTLTVDAKDDISGVYQMAFSNDGINWHNWEPFFPIKSFILSTGDGIKTVYFKVKDQIDNIAIPIFDTIILNTTRIIDTDTDGIPDDIDFDDDNDGIPDDWELKYGYNTTNPADALLDPDLDDLINFEEYLNNTHPAIFDTDKDGLSDGDEIKYYHTNATNPDTDGDGYDDGTEILKGTNPLDEDEYPDKKQEKTDDGDYSLYIIIVISIVIIIIFFKVSGSKPKIKEKDENDELEE